MKQKILLIIRRVLKTLRVHRNFALLISVLVIALVVVIRIVILSNAGIDQEYLIENENKVQTVNFREDAIKEIESLRDSNVNVPGVQLPSGRQNPFSE
jgi:uncharacterized membrane protein (DUF106 family)